MAPPLRFFVLSAYGSLGNRLVPVYLSGTVRSQGFSPSQRFHPAQALRLCFASHPPIGFSVFRAFPAHPAVASLDARCSSAVSPSSDEIGFPLPHFAPALHHLPKLAFQRHPLCESSVRLNARRNISSLAKSRSSSVGGERSRRLPRLVHGNSSRGSTSGRKSDRAMTHWHGVPTLEPCSD